MSPDATVSMTEIMAGGAEGGKGTLNFQGHSYRFQLVGGVTGGGGAANTQATGEVYNLHNISDFKGLYTQSSGGPGLRQVGCQRFVATQCGRGSAASEGDAGGCLSESGPRGNLDRNALTRSAGAGGDRGRTRSRSRTRVRMIGPRIAGLGVAGGSARVKYATPSIEIVLDALAR